MRKWHTMEDAEPKYGDFCVIKYNPITNGLDPTDFERIFDVAQYRKGKVFEILNCDRSALDYQVDKWSRIELPDETFSLDEALAIAKAESSDAWRACVYISLVCDGMFPEPDDRTIKHMCKRFMHDRARIAKSGCKRLWSVLEKVRRAFSWTK